MPRYSWNLLTGLYRLDFFNLLLCMAVGHVIVGNPFFGATVYLFADIIKAYYLCNLGKLRHAGGDHYLSDLAMAVIFMIGISAAFIYPLTIGLIEANYVSLFALCIVMRDYFGTVSVFPGKNRRGARYYLSVAFIHLCFDAGCAYLLWRRTEPEVFAVMMAIVLLTGIRRLFSPETRIPVDSRSIENKYEMLASYKLFSDMNLYATIAVNLGIMAFFYYMLVPLRQQFDYRQYISMAAWLLLVFAVIWVAGLVIRKRWRGVALAEFIAGALTWLFGMIMMFNGRTMAARLAWTVAWGVGMAFMFSSVRKFYFDFEAVGRIMGEGYDREELRISNTIVSTTASIASSAIMLLVMFLWMFVVPLIPDTGFPRVYNMLVLQLPAVFMLVAVVMALKQPLDRRNREKLMVFIREHSKNEDTRDSLQRMFVRKYRMRFGIKIICTLAKPFFRLKVSGREHLRKKDYPSVFVSNHNFIYGPIAAVIYLPTYFRPWIHNVMLEPETAAKEIARPFGVVIKIFGRRLGGAIIRFGARLTCWALNSFNPIPVVRGASRDVMSTFDRSIRALEEGDNILIFPEKPKRMVNPDGAAGEDVLRTFYTGFAHIAKMYYDRTGKALLFYPLYSDMGERAFRIGEPVAYDPSLEPHEGKRRLSEQLQKRVAELSEKS